MEHHLEPSVMMVSQEPPLDRSRERNRGCLSNQQNVRREKENSREYETYTYKASQRYPSSFKGCTVQVFSSSGSLFPRILSKLLEDPWSPSPQGKLLHMYRLFPFYLLWSILRTIHGTTFHQCRGKHRLCMLE